MQRGAAGVEAGRVLFGCCAGELRGVDGKMLVHEIVCLAPQKICKDQFHAGCFTKLAARSLPG